MDKRTATISLPNRGTILLLGLLVIALGAGFIGGVSYQKSKLNTSVKTTSVQQGQFNGQSGQFGPRNGTFGAVTAVSASSITISDRRSGSTKTYSISSATTITKDGAPAAVSDIVVGDQVMMQLSSSTSTTATAITINPTMRGGPGAQSGVSGDSTSNMSSN